MSEIQNKDEFPYHIPLPNGKKITIYNNGNNENIYYYFRFGKKSYQGSTGTSNIELSIKEGFRIYSEVSTGKRKTGSKGSTKFEVVCKKYLEYKENKEEDIRKKNLSPRTLIEYKRHSKFLIEKFSGREIETLCNEKIYENYQNWRSNYYKEHPSEKQFKFKRKIKGKQKPKTLKGRVLDHVGSVPINRELRLLVSILRYSKYTLNLLPDIEIPPYKMLDENRGKKILTDQEYVILREYMSVNRPFQWMIISFINSTGIRYPSEFLRITWDCVDWKTPCIWIRNRKNPKSNESLDTPVPLVGTSLEILKTLWSRENENISKEPDSPVFVNEKGVLVKNVKKSFKYCLKKCGLDESITIYSFRHRFTTRMILREDIPVVVLSKVLGHKSTEMVMKHYEQLNKDNYLKVFQNSRDNFYRKKQEEEQQQKKQTNVESDVEPDVPDFVSG